MLDRETVVDEDGRAIRECSTCEEQFVIDSLAQTECRECNQGDQE